MKYTPLAGCLILVTLASCTAPKSAMTASESQLMIRQAQTRDYEKVSKKQAMRASIATLQDLCFVLDKVDADLGMITASTYKNNTSVKVTITVREKAPLGVTIRANATYGQCAIEDPVIYQDFFAMLDKSLFLVQNDI